MPRIDQCLESATKGLQIRRVRTLCLVKETVYTETGIKEIDMKRCQTRLGLYSVHRYRQITIGLALVYFAWLAFLAWIAFKVLTA
jgi:hypothetical protein